MKILDKIKEIFEKIFYRKKLFLSRNEFSLLAYEYRGLEMYIRNSAYQHIRPRVGFYVLWHQICNYLNKINGYSLG